MNWNPRRFAFVFFAVFVGLVFSGCGGGTHTSRLTHLTVAPTSASVVAGGPQQFTATGLFGDGTTQDETAAVTWTSSNSAIATIVSGGVATGVAAGTANITASLFGVTSNAGVLTVTPSSTLISIAVTPAFPTIAAGGMQQFTATGTYTNVGGPNTTQDITGQVTWASITTAAATIDASGLATGVANGASVISATLTGVTGQTTLTVGVPVVVGLKVSPINPSAAAGTTVVFSVLELLSDGSTQPLSGTITWASDTPATATIPANSRVAQALTVGTAVISATESGTACSGAACAGSSTLTVVAAQARFAYLADANAPSFDAYSVVPATGVFTALASPTANFAVQVIVHPSGHFLYIIDGTSFVAVFDVNSTTGVAAQDVSIPTVPAGVSGFAKGLVDRTGKFFFAVSNNNQTGPVDALYAYTINQTTGALTPVTGSPFTTNLNVPVDIQIAHQTSAANDYLYVINNGAAGTNSNTVAGFSVDPTTGVPTALGTPTIATGSGPFYSTVDPSGTHLYVPNSNDSTVSEYSIATTGILTQVGTATAITDGTNSASFVFNVAVDPSDTHLYVVDNPTAVGAVYGFNIGANGAIGTSIGLNIATGDTPTGIVIDPTGTLLAVDNNFGDTISPYAIGSGGVLTAYPVVTTGDAPQFLTFYTAVAGQ
jgi:6-phosphogluconolactonase (cycloisomerase 2 family)